MGTDSPNAAQPLKRSAGLALFALGFRPFYLLAALLAALSLPLWVGQYIGLLPQLGYMSAIAWHAHEMVFGFAAAVLSGFLFTAVRNWTGQPTPTGSRLAGLAALWLAARVLLISGPALPAALIDLAFLPLVAWSLWRPLRRARNRNQFFVVLLAVFAAANLAFHLGQAGIVALAPIAAAEAALALLVVIVAIMSGRVIPSFTHNAVAHAAVKRIKGLDGACIGVLAAALVAWLAALPSLPTAALCLAAAILNAARLWQWDPLSTRAQPILWILHLSYAWIAVGMLLIALALVGVLGTAASALHALSIGAIGGMIIGMMTRTARGHTGRPLIAGKAEVLAYVLVHLAALSRVLGPLVWPAQYAAAVVLAAALWSGAFAIYAIVYWKILTRARIDGQPG